MAEVKLVVAYPPPRDVDDFEREYLNEHLAMARAKLPGATKICFVEQSRRRLPAWIF